MRFAPKSKRMMTNAMISSVPPNEPKPIEFLLTNHLADTGAHYTP